MDFGNAGWLDGGCFLPFTLHWSGFFRAVVYGFISKMGVERGHCFALPCVLRACELARSWHAVLEIVATCCSMFCFARGLASVCSV